VQKRTFKFNILDVVILIVVICSVAVLVFRDTINEVFEEPTMVTLEVSVNVNGEDNVDKVLDVLSQAVIFEPRSNEGIAFRVNFANINVVPIPNGSPNEAEVKFVCIGYKKLGRYYTKSGERIYNNTECAFIIGGERIVGNVISINEKGAE